MNSGHQLSEPRHGQFIFDWENERNVLTRHSARHRTQDAGSEARGAGTWATLSPPVPGPQAPHTSHLLDTGHRSLVSIPGHETILSSSRSFKSIVYFIKIQENEDLKVALSKTVGKTSYE